VISEARWARMSRVRLKSTQRMVSCRLRQRVLARHRGELLAPAVSRPVHAATAVREAAHDPKRSFHCQPRLRIFLSLLDRLTQIMALFAILLASADRLTRRVDLIIAMARELDFVLDDVCLDASWIKFIY
jgi:hypothetical protein